MYKDDIDCVIGGDGGGARDWWVRAGDLLGVQYQALTTPVVAATPPGDDRGSRPCYYNDTRDIATTETLSTTL